MAFENLKLVASMDRSPLDAVSKRRQRLFMQINKQIDYAGKFGPGRLQRGRWFRQNADGSFSLAIRYGRKDLELAKAKFGIACASTEELVEALQAVRLQCSQGFFDVQLEKLSKEIRKPECRLKGTCAPTALGARRGGFLVTKSAQAA